jgi:hypothetical protein
MGVSSSFPVFPTGKVMAVKFSAANIGNAGKTSSEKQNRRTRSEQVMRKNGFLRADWASNCRDVKLVRRKVVAYK